MNYSTDKAITCHSEDLLGRTSFSKQLGKAITEYQSNDSLVIGLFGKWGTGKTSVINMVLESLSSSSSSESPVPIILKFAPWNYSDKANLISIFFSELSSKISSDKSIASRKKIGEALQNYSGALQATAMIPKIGPIIAPLLTNVAKATGAYLSKTGNLDKLKLDLSEKLKMAKRKIVVVIDDIDRLTNEQIRDIFQLVKQVGDLPNIIYLLSMDRGVVTNALSEIHKCDGNEYLEKIIHVPFEIPELSKDKIDKIFFDRFHKVVENAMSNPVIDQRYLNLVFTNCISPYLYTIRDVNRVINVFQFKVGLLHKEIYVEDMIAITSIEVLNPTLYKWIISNKFALCGKSIDIDELDHNMHKDTHEYYDNVFRGLGLDTVKTTNCLSALFPSFAGMIGKSLSDKSEIRGKMRIAFDKRFDYCFSLDEDYISVPRKLINDFIFNYSKSALIRTVNNEDIRNNYNYFIDELESLIDSIPYNRIALIASVFLNVSPSQEEIDSPNLYLFSAYSFSMQFADDLIRKLLTSEERFNTYYSAFTDCTISSFPTLAHILFVLERAYGRIEENKKVPNDQIIDFDHLKELESVFIKNATKLFQHNIIVEVSDFEFILCLWRKIDSKSADDYINSILSDDVLALKLICLFASKWISTEGSGWRFNSTNYSGYFTNESIKTRIEKIDKKEINKFTHDEQIKLASFIMNYGKSRDEHVTMDKAQDLVDEWNSLREKTDNH